MSAAEVLKAARASGIRIRVDGDDLVLEASAPPPPAVLDLLARHKAEILVLLRPSDDGAPDDGSVAQAPPEPSAPKPDVPPSDPTTTVASIEPRPAALERPSDREVMPPESRTRALPKVRDEIARLAETGDENPIPNSLRRTSGLPLCVSGDPDAVNRHVAKISAWLNLGERRTR
jgi:hypothetical protein